MITEFQETGELGRSLSYCGKEKKPFHHSGQAKGVCGGKLEDSGRGAHESREEVQISRYWHPDSLAGLNSKGKESVQLLGLGMLRGAVCRNLCEESQEESGRPISHQPHCTTWLWMNLRQGHSSLDTAQPVSETLESLIGDFRRPLLSTQASRNAMGSMEGEYDTQQLGRKQSTHITRDRLDPATCAGESCVD